MGRLHKKKTENQQQKKKLKITATQDENPETPPAELKFRKSGEGRIDIDQEEKASKDSFVSRLVAKPVKKTAVAKRLEFFHEAHAELLKVVWPSKAQAMASTGVVIILVIILSFFLGISDAVLTKLVQLALN